MQISFAYFIVLVTVALAGCDTSSKSSGSPNTGNTPPPALSEEADKLVKAIMQQSGATAVTLAIAKDGEIQYKQAYGFKDFDKTVRLETDALMRTASIVKPVTAAAVRELESVGVLSLSDHVFCDGNNTPCWLSEALLSETTDPRASEITIEHLVSHTGGWYSDISGDPLEQEVEIRDALNLTGPPSREDIIRQVMRRPLDYTPGMPDFVHANYSNFGYLLLGLIVEQATNMDYTQYVQMEIMADVGVAPDDFKKGASQLVNHDAREPVYISTDLCPSTFTLGVLALCSEEGADNQNWFSALGMLSTASAMALFAQEYRLPNDYTAGYAVIGEPISMPSAHGSHGGSLPGLSSMVRQLPSGESYAIFLNISFNLEPMLPSLDGISKLQP